MKNLLRKEDPWKDGEDRYVGIVILLHHNPKGHIRGPEFYKAGHAHYDVLGADWEEIPNLTYSNLWHDWTEKLCLDEIDDEPRVSYFAFTVVNNKAKGIQRVIAVRYHGEDPVAKKLVDNGQALWDALPVRFTGRDDEDFIQILPAPESATKTTTKKSAPKKRIAKKKPLRKALA